MADQGTASGKFRATLLCHTLVIGCHAKRVNRVLSLLPENDESAPNEPNEPTRQTRYHACVSRFDSYDDGGTEKRYLMKCELVPQPQPQSNEYTSIANLVDEMTALSSRGGKNPIHQALVLAIGCGIDSEEDVEMIRTFIRSLLPVDTESNTQGRIDLTIACTQPNPDFDTMTDENDYFAKLSASEKETAVTEQTLGPGKMARFVTTLTHDAISKLQTSVTKAADVMSSTDTNDSIHLPDNQSDANHPVAAAVPLTSAASLLRSSPPDSCASCTTIPPQPQCYYACRKCRTVLFRENDLENPPHAESFHCFSIRKQKHAGLNLGANSHNKCGSMFLQKELPWMDQTSSGEINSSNEGKLKCPKCSSKVGVWKWSGTQCPCGTWVTPAIYFPLGKIDVITV